jgi:Cys-rich protein (TIGR01571 family)
MATQDPNQAQNAYPNMSQQPMQGQVFQGQYSGNPNVGAQPVMYGAPQGTAYTLNGQMMQSVPPQGYNTGQPIYAGQPGQQPMYAGQPGQPVYAQPIGNGQMAIPVAAVYDNGQPVTYQGRWSDGICDCFQDVPSCCWSFWFSPYRFAKTMSGAGLLPFQTALLMYFVPWLFVVIFDILGSPEFTSCCPWASYVGGAAFLIMATIATVYRIRLRQKYNIPGGELEDFCCHFCCECCAVAQEARHVDRALNLIR